MTSNSDFEHGKFCIEFQDSTKKQKLSLMPQPNKDGMHNANPAHKPELCLMPRFHQSRPWDFTCATQFCSIRHLASFPFGSVSETEHHACPIVLFSSLLLLWFCHGWVGFLLNIFFLPLFEVCLLSVILSLLCWWISAQGVLFWKSQSCVRCSSHCSPRLTTYSFCAA